MRDELISFKTAVIAKEKGFKPEREWNPEYVSGYIEDEKNNFKLTEIQEEDYSREGYYLAPTQSFLQKWLREKHNIDLWFGMLNPPNKYHVEDIIKNDIIIGGINIGKPTYEEALEDGLLEALKLI